MDLPQKSQFIIYQSQDGKIKLDVRFEAESVWLTQAMIVELFQSSKSNISEHIKNIFAEGELNENSVVRFFRTTAADGKQYFAQGQAMQRILMYMKDWVKKLDAFISINGREILKDAGTISRDLALSKAEKEYELFDKTRVKFLSETPSDFDNFVAKTQAKIVKAKRGNARGKGKKDAK